MIFLVLKLTVVDLPGIIRVTVGKQENEAIQTIREMVLDYIKNDKCIILAVTPTGQDIANSDALELAKVVDPNSKMIFREKTFMLFGNYSCFS